MVSYHLQAGLSSANPILRASAADPFVASFEQAVAVEEEATFAVDTHVALCQAVPCSLGLFMSKHLSFQACVFSKTNGQRDYSLASWLVIEKSPLLWEAIS